MLLLIAPAHAFADEHYFDFRGPPPLPKELEVVGQDADRYVTSEAAGLRITLPRDRKSLTPVSVRTLFGLEGDFEITATVEILQAEPPASATSVGSGVALYIEKTEPPGEGTNVGRMMRAEGKDLIIWDRKYVVGGADPKYEGAEKRCTEKLVRLRMVRKGTKLSYLWSPGEDGIFQKIHYGEFGANEIKEVTVKVTTGSEPRIVDIRVIDLRIVTGNPSGVVGWEAIGLFVVAAIVVLAIGGWLWNRFMLRSGAKSAGQNAESTSAPPPSTPTLSFICSECGTKLKVKMELVGKKIKCPHCAKSVLVPES